MHAAVQGKSAGHESLADGLYAAQTLATGGSEMALLYKACFGSSFGQVAFDGRLVDDGPAFEIFLRTRAAERLIDKSHRAEFERELRALATTTMATETLERLLFSEVPLHAREPWELGEAIAECLLEDEHQVHWPWHIERDKRTPRASLPGADVIGFLRRGGNAILFIGEVKTSSDQDVPPNVLYGRGGMTHQLEELANNQAIHFSLLRWLRARCEHGDLAQMYRAAVTRYLASQGRDMLLVGVLLRDTPPNERDLMARAKSVSAMITAPTELRLTAWYLPRPADSWPRIAAGGS